MTSSVGAATATVGAVAALRRYPVKSMLGEDVTELVLVEGGVLGDRALALLDVETGRVATAKHPRLWRGLLRFTAVLDGTTVRIAFPDGSVIGSDDAGVDRALSDAIGRPVHLSGARPDGAIVERPAPEDVLDHGVDADVPFVTLEIAQGTTGTTFVDYAPVHLITTATLGHIGTEAVRYRPNIVVETAEVGPYAENRWVGREITVGPVRLRGSLPTPRCAVPTLEHGELPRAAHSVRIPMAENRVDVPGFGVLPCAGLYAEVLVAGTVRAGDRVTLL